MANFEHFQNQLQMLSDRQRLRRLVPRKPDGIRFLEDGRTLVNFGSNDYLGLSAERNHASAAGGSGASALVCGWTDLHQQLAETIARLESTEAAVVFPSGFAACSGTVATLPDRDDLILSDALNHASLIDGCRLSRALCVVYPHRDTGFVEQVLREKRDRHLRVWIVTDGVFSMDGHVAPLGELCDIADRYDANLIVDEAHGTGVLGETGSGVCEAAGVKSRVPIRIGTLSKAVGGQGGFVAAQRVVIDYLVNRCRSLIYSTSLAPTAVVAAIDGLAAIAQQPQRRQRVQSLARSLRSRLSIDADPLEAAVPIIPLVVGADLVALEASRRLAEAGYFVPAIRPPTVPEGTARLRISLSAAHDDAMVAGLVEALEACI